MAAGEYEVVLEEQEEGGYVASVPDLPGLWTKARLVREAIASYLEALEELGRPVRVCAGNT